MILRVWVKYSRETSSVKKSSTKVTHTHTLNIYNRSRIKEQYTRRREAHITIAIHSLIKKEKYTPQQQSRQLLVIDSSTTKNTVVVYKWSSWKRPQLQPQRPPWRLQPRSRHSHRSPPCRRGQRMSLTIQGESIHHISKTIHLSRRSSLKNTWLTLI